MSKTVNVSEMFVAVLSGEAAVLMVDNVHEDGGLFFDLLTDVVIIVENDDEWVLIQVLTF